VFSELRSANGLYANAKSVVVERALRLLEWSIGNMNHTIVVENFTKNILEFDT
jgi:hypothetical protein